MFIEKIIIDYPDYKKNLVKKVDLVTKELDAALRDEINRLNGIKEIIKTWKRFCNDYKQPICAVDPAPLSHKISLWTQNDNSYFALNTFLWEYAGEFKKRNKKSGVRRLFLINYNKLDEKSARDMAFVINYHLELGLEVGVLSIEDFKTDIKPEFYNFNVINKKTAINAKSFEDSIDHPIEILSSKKDINTSYEIFREMFKKAIKFNNMPLNINYKDNNLLKGRITLSAGSKFYIYLKSGGRCMNCKKRINLQYDHIYPFSLNGSSNIDNYQILCAKCNNRKSNWI